jgi:hypothetical protein
MSFGLVTLKKGRSQARDCLWTAPDTWSYPGLLATAADPAVATISWIPNCPAVSASAYAVISLVQ